MSGGSKGGGGGGGIAGDSGDKRWGDTTSKKGEISRVFVGNIDSYKTTCTDLREYHFEIDENPTKRPS